MESIRVLLVDDDKSALDLMRAALEARQFKVTPVAGVAEALGRIHTDTFDVLVTDQRMPGAADGFTLISATRSAQPHALTVLTSGNPDTQAAMDAIVLQADEILSKPLDIGALDELIGRRIAGRRGCTRTPKDTVAAILERRSEAIVADWLVRLKEDVALSWLQLDDSDRIGHLPRLVRDLVVRLGSALGPASKSAKVSISAAEHGMLRYSHGYSIEMIVDESRHLKQARGIAEA